MLTLGGRGLLVVVVVVVATFFGTRWAGKRLGVSNGLSLLVATGFSICGVSAIAAARGMSDADEEEVTYAIALVTLCGSLAIVLLPALNRLLGMSEHDYGAWVGASVHDIAQVVATSSAVGGVAVATAVVVKLTRVLLLGPLVAWISWREGRSARVSRGALVPPFVLAFVAAAALRSADLVPSGLLPVSADAKTVLLAVALFAVGARVELRRLLAVGGRPLVLGLSSWVIVAAGRVRGGDGGVVVSRPTMRDVAGQAGVSLQTVSNYVNGRFNLMSVETRERVGRELDRLGYWPNAAARSLRAKRTMTLGFLVLDEGARFLADPMTDLIIAGIGDVARDHGYSLLIQAARPDPDDADRLFSPLLEERVDGAFLFLSGAPSVRRRTIRRVDELGFSFVVFEQAPAGVPVVSVTAENRAGARQLTEHLLGSGHRRIAFISTRTPWPMVEERLRGYREALSAAGVSAPELEVTDGVWDPATARGWRSGCSGCPTRRRRSCAATTCSRSARSGQPGSAVFGFPTTSR